jgi:DNA-directed RNA polymerase
MKPTLQEYLPTLKASDQANGISPNFVHSLDAAALQITVCELHQQEGVEEFCMVHDSYGTLAADAELLSRYLREVFVWMYEEHDVLSELRESVQATLEEELPAPPVPGSLDLSLVRESDFFFA